MNSQMIPGYFFQSEMFSIHPGEDENTNPGCYGKEVGEWLCRKLAEEGYQTELIPEDWGWCVMCETSPYHLWVGCRAFNLEYDGFDGSTDQLPKPSEVIWNVFVEIEIPFYSLKAFFKKLFGMLDTLRPYEKLNQRLKTILENETEVQLCSPPRIQDLIEKLKKRWGAELLAPGVTQEAIAEFEKKNKVLLPEDMKEYFQITNGMGEEYNCDDDWFYFWPLEKMITIAEDLPDRAHKFPEASSYYYFADHSMNLISYAIKLSPDPEEKNTVSWVITDYPHMEGEVEYSSFREFLDLYLDDPINTVP